MKTLVIVFDGEFDYQETRVTAAKVAYDGCHKFYYIEDEQDEAEAISYEYELYPFEDFIKLWDESCPLRFLSNWKLTKHPIEQCVEIEGMYFA